MFVYILELLNGKGNLAFFDLKVGGCKANNAQKEKRHLARKRSCASKQEREREAAKAAKLPAHQRQCEACGRKFESRKTAKKHKCPSSKVVRVPREAASGQASQATPTAKVDTPPAPLTTHAPIAPVAGLKPHAPRHIIPTTAVTGELPQVRVFPQRLPEHSFIENLYTGLIRQVPTDQLEYYVGTERWKVLG